MDKKRGRGRPKVTGKLAGNHTEQFEKVILNGQKFRSRRSVADSVYAFKASTILWEAASEIEGLEVLFRPDEYMCRSILNQLGRMHMIEGYSNEDVIAIAKEAIKGKKDGYSVKEIEKYIRYGRLTGEW